MFERPPTSQSELFEIGQALAEDIERAEKERIQLEDFRGAKYFTDEEIDRDIAFTKIKKSEFEEREANSPPEVKKMRENARIIELFLPMAIKDYDWLGENTNVIQTSTYDDYANGVDSVVQMMEPNETRNLGLEIDFTSSIAEMEDKIKRIGTSIQEGKVARVKYFDSLATGKLKNLKMPKIAFGAPFNEIMDFADAFVEARKNPQSEGLRKAVMDHPLKNKFLEYTANQLQEFGRLAAEAGNIELALLHHNVLETMKSRGLMPGDKK